MSDYCPKCAFPNYVCGICLNNDCNWPSLESNNARALRKAKERAQEKAKADAEQAARAQAKAKAEQNAKAKAESRREQAKTNKPATHDTKASPSSSAERQSILLGRFVGVIGALLACSVIHKSNPQNPAALWLVAPLAFVICSYLHLPILIGLLCAGCAGGALSMLTPTSPNLNENMALLAFLIGAIFHKAIARFLAFGFKVVLLGALGAAAFTTVFLAFFRTP
jgi:cation transport ATPase